MLIKQNMVKNIFVDIVTILFLLKSIRMSCKKLPEENEYV